MSVRTFAFLFLLIVAGTALASCPPHDFSDPKRVHIVSDSVLIVTHATSFHDARLASKRGTDEAVRFAKARRIPIIFLQDDSPPQFYFMEDCRPDHWVYSEGGSIQFDVEPTHVYVAGGHLELCLSATLHDVLFAWAKKPLRNRVITYFMDGIYSNGKSVEESDSFYQRFSRFMTVVTYGRPAGEHWPKLTLLETMGLIRNEEHEYEYLRRILPRWDRGLPADYRVELQLNDSIKKLLRSASGWNPPTIRFHFVDSALKLEDLLLFPTKG
ncbi:MAG: hypothetical protein IT509_11465 [Rhodocyclaceae bacterium]|nr:hypothetical protein [Rhodocyclaceae bacterium]